MFEARLGAADTVVVLLPHTRQNEADVDAYLAWVHAGRPAASGVVGSSPDDVWDLDTPPDPLNFARMIPIEADFRVTALASNGAWQSPDDLEAARSLLEARFDLDIGIWDLVNNRILRNSLLKSSPAPLPPAKPAALPRGAAARADAAVQRKVDEQARLKEIYRHSQPLQTLGWVRSNLEPYSFLTLSMGEDVLLGPRAKPPMWMALSMTRHQSQLIVRAPMQFPDFSLSGFINGNRIALAQISDFEIEDKGGFTLLWKATGGWADDEVDWQARFHELADKSRRWAAVLFPCAAILGERLKALATRARGRP